MKKKYLSMQITKGKPYWYFRRKGVRVRLPGEPGTREFDDAYWQAMSATPRIAGAYTWAKLAKSYQKSDRYNRLKPRTRADYDKVIAHILAKAGNTDPTDYRRKDVIAAQSAQSHRVRFANYIPQVMSVMFEHAIDIGWMNENPAKGVRRIGGKVKHHKAWPQEMVDAYRATAKGMALLAFELGIGTGQRPSDLTRLRWSDFDGQGFDITQGKTGKALYIPATKRLLALLAETRRRGPFVLTRRNGKPMDYHALARAVKTVRDKIGAEDCTPHGWRYNAAQELAREGWSDEVIASVTGHDSLRMVAQYTGKVRQKARAQKAQEKRE